MHAVGLAARSVDPIKINTITYLEQSVNDWQTGRVSTVECVQKSVHAASKVSKEGKTTTTTMVMMKIKVFAEKNEFSVLDRMVMVVHQEPTPLRAKVLMLLL